MTCFVEWYFLASSILFFWHNTKSGLCLVWWTGVHNHINFNLIIFQIIQSLMNPWILGYSGIHVIVLLILVTGFLLTFVSIHPNAFFSTFFLLLLDVVNFGTKSMTTLNSETIAKALKGGGLSSKQKILKAREAWNDNTFFFPNKDEFLLSWICACFAKPNTKK